MQLVLAVDDSKVALLQIKKYIQKSYPNCEVITVTNPIEGIEIAKEKQAKLDMILLDFNMKEMNGLDTILQLENFFDLSKVAICSANTQKILIDKITNKGVLFIDKPLSQEKIDDMTASFKTRQIKGKAS